MFCTTLLVSFTFETNAEQKMSIRTVNERIFLTTNYLYNDDILGSLK